LDSAWAVFGNDVPLVKPTLLNSTTVIPEDQKYWAEPLLRALTSNPNRTNEWMIHLTQNMAADIFLGQIVACVVVVIFVCLFFLREWVVQNAHPGVLEDAPQDVEGDAGANAAVVDLDGVVGVQQQELLRAEIQRKNEETQQAETEHKAHPTVLEEILKELGDEVMDDQKAAEPAIAVQTTSLKEENQIRDDVAEPPESIQHAPPTWRKTRPSTPDINSWATAISSQVPFPLHNGTVVASPLLQPPPPEVQANSFGLNFNYAQPPFHNGTVVTSPLLPPPPPEARANSFGLNFDYAQPPFNRVGPLNPTTKPQPFPPWVATSDALAQRDPGGNIQGIKPEAPRSRPRNHPNSYHSRARNYCQARRCSSNMASAKRAMEVCLRQDRN